MIDFTNVIHRILSYRHQFYTMIRQTHISEYPEEAQFFLQANELNEWYFQFQWVNLFLLLILYKLQQAEIRITKISICLICMNVNL